MPWLVLSPRLLIFLMSVMTNGIFWVGQQTQLNHFASADRNLAWIHIAFLCSITLTPFSTSLLAEFIHYRIALLTYWFNILLLGLTLYWSWSYATRAPSSRRRRPRRNSPGRRPPHRDRAIPLRLRRRPLLSKHLLQHRRHCVGPGELRDRSKILLGIILTQCGSEALDVRVRFDASRRSWVAPLWGGAALSALR